MTSRARVLLLILFLIALGGTGLAVITQLRRPMHMAVAQNKLLVFDVPGDVEEAPPLFSAFSLSAFRRERPTLLEYTTAIRNAADDAGIRGLVLHIGGIGWGWARLAELREALGDFRASGKPIYASLAGGGEAEYLLASSANPLAMPPTSTLQLDGLAASAMFLKGTYDKLGISPNFGHVGRYKSAVEQYTRTDLSPSAREAMEALLDDTYRVLVDSLAVARRITPDSMLAMIDNGPYTAEDARATGLIDTLLDEADLDSLAAGRKGHPLGTITMERYLNRDDGDTGGAEMALVVASGEIVSGKSRDDAFNGGQCGSESVVAALREARRKASVKAVILRVDSPGGSGDASDEIWREVHRVRRVKPVIVSMSNLAASGGYYIACDADAIVAEPATITGSIGVFGGKFNIIGLMHKLGLNIDTVSRGKHAEMMSPYRDFTAEEADRFQRHLDAFYRVFLQRVSAGRHMTTAAVDSIGQGRVWSGIAAQRLGLVDSLGGMNAALALARRHAGLAADADIDLELYPKPRRSYLRRMLDNLFNEEDDDTNARLRALVLSPAVRTWAAAAQFPSGVALAMMPYTIEIR